MSDRIITALAMTATLELDQVLDSILTQLEQVLAYDSAAVLLLQGDQLFLAAGRGFPKKVLDQLVGQRLPATISLFVEIRLKKQPICLPDARSDPRFANWGDLDYIRGWIGVPLVSRGEVIGILTVDNRRVAAYNEVDAVLAQAFANQAAIAIENARLYKAEQRARQMAETVRAANLALTQSLNLDTILATLLDFLSRLIPYDTANVMLLQKDNQIVMHSLHGHERWADKAAIKKITFNLETNKIFQTLVRTQRGLLIEDTHSYPGWEIPPAAQYVRNWIGVPLVGGGKTIGFYSLNKAQPGFFTEEHLQLAEMLASQAAIAIQNAQLFSETNRWVHRLTILNELGRQTTGLLETRELCHTVAEHLCHAFGYLSVSIFTTNAASREIVLQAIVGPHADFVRVGEYRQGFGEGLIGRAAEIGEKLVVNDTQQHPHFRASRRLDIRSEVVFPLRAGSSVVGVLNVDSDKLNAFDESDVTVLTIAADQLAVALEKARLFEETGRRTAELEAIADVSTALRAAHTVEEMLPIILEKVIEVAGGITGSIFLAEPETDELVERGTYPVSDGLLRRRHNVGQGITGHVASTGEIYVTDDMRQDPLFHLLAGEDERLRGVKGSISLPLHTQERIVGVMHIGLPPKHAFTEVSTRLLIAISEIAGSALDRAMIMETLEMRVQERTHELAEANLRLQELDRLKSKFVSDVSHELRTPITNLSLYLDLFKQGRPDKHAKYLEVLDQQAERLTHLIEDILSLSRLELGRDKVEFAPVAFNAVVERVVTAYRPRIEVAGLALTLSLQDGLPQVVGERNQLAQVINNLLTNAINYTLAGRINLSTRWDKKRGQVCLSVSDTGPGIAQEDLENLFDRFYRGELASQLNIPGTGLGLAIVKEIVDLHGGTIEVHSEAGSGSTFRVWLSPKK